MNNKRRRFSRSVATRDYRPVFIIATEGKETEPQYFKMKLFQPPHTTVRVETLATKQNPSPASVLARMKKFLNEYSVKKGIHAWLVVDKDTWTDGQLDQLNNWACEIPTNRGLAVSNPQFEFWLLLHFESANNVSSQAVCMTRLKNHCPEYSKKHLPTQKFDDKKVADAICRAYSKDNPPCDKWPLIAGSTVYRLVYHILYLYNE